MAKKTDTTNDTNPTDINELELKAEARRKALNEAFSAAYRAGLEAACTTVSAAKRGEKAGKKRAIEILGEADLAERLAEETRFVLAGESVH